MITLLQACGFLLAAYAVLSNDALQTLGTFLAGNRGRTPRLAQAFFLCAVLVAVLLLGWLRNAGDPAWGRLEHFTLPESFSWIDLLPPLAVLALTQWGAPVSTSFLLLTSFGPGALPALLLHSLLGYAVALLFGGGVYRLLGSLFPGSAAAVERPGLWLVLQWAATGWLWSQWLIQDLANLYIYLPRQLEPVPMGASLAVLCAGVCLLTAENGGAIQQVLSSKSQTQDPRATTLLSALFGLLLFALARWSPLPLSTTWVFLGLLGGRELALAWQQPQPPLAAAGRSLGADLLKAGLGLAASVAVALAVPLLKATL